MISIIGKRPSQQRTSIRCRDILLAMLCALSLAFSPHATAQRPTAESTAVSLPLPDAPTPQAIMYSSLGQSTEETLSSISGTVLDGTRAAIRGAKVSLLNEDGALLKTTFSGTGGDFTFVGVSLGSYRVQVDAVGFSRITSAEFKIGTQQAFSVPAIVLSIAGTNTEVTVLPTEVIAAQQIKAEEQQRVLGLFANFYVSYIPDAAPLDVKQKFSLAVHDTLDWSTFVGVSAAAGLEQATNAFPGYGQGASGYGKRWGAQFADGRTSDLLSHAVFASLFHQDPRYFYQGSGTKKSRLYHAIGSAFVTRSDSGRTVPNYSYLAGAAVSGAISNAYYPASDRGVGLVFTTAGIGIAGRAAQSVVEEFIAKRFTTHVYDSKNPKADFGAAKP